MTTRQRRVRADGLANRERILESAARMFADHGVDVPLDEIAASAGVGSATLHRHFAGRLDLVHQVLDAEAERLAARAANRADGPAPAQALTEWLLELIQFTGSFRGLAALLGRNQADTTLEQRHRSLYDAGRQLLTRAQQQRNVRTAVTIADLLKLANGIAIAADGSPETARRLLDLLTSGLAAPDG